MHMMLCTRIVPPSKITRGGVVTEPLNTVFASTTNSPVAAGGCVRGPVVLVTTSALVSAVAELAAYDVEALAVADSAADVAAVTAISLTCVVVRVPSTDDSPPADAASVLVTTALVDVTVACSVVVVIDAVASLSLRAVAAAEADARKLVAINATVSAPEELARVEVVRAVVVLADTAVVEVEELAVVLAYDEAEVPNEAAIAVLVENALADVDRETELAARCVLVTRADVLASDVVPTTLPTVVVARMEVALVVNVEECAAFVEACRDNEASVALADKDREVASEAVDPCKLANSDVPTTTVAAKVDALTPAVPSACLR